MNQNTQIKYVLNLKYQELLVFTYCGISTAEK